MAKDMIDKMKEHFAELAKRPPRLSILSDNPLPEAELFEESFNLSYRVGPAFEIIRHEDMQTPLTIAIYGRWGAGKTTAMRWLEKMLEEWTKTGPATWKEGRRKREKIKIRTVRFAPWKYHNKEDVWRGLISEVILASVLVEDVTAGRVKKAAKDFGLFLGRSFLNALASVKLKAGLKEAGGEIDLSVIKDILADYQQVSHPEKAFLNEFESTLDKWVGETIRNQGERLVVFIDDLDRCMPEIALEVLEALKLYLSIKDLIFVVGLDREVVDRLVEYHYEKQGFDREQDKEKSRKYLAKMFQVELTVGPSVKQIGRYRGERLGRIWSWQQLEETEREVFDRVISKLAGRNPREVKRMINSALMAGMGAEMMPSREVDPEIGEISFAQGMQVFFVRQILQEREQRYGRYEYLVGDPLGDSFFGAWSGIVRQHYREEGFSVTVKVPEDWPSEVRAGEDIGEGSLDEVAERLGKREALRRPEFAHEAYHEMLAGRKFSSLLTLLGDEELGELMRIAYPTDTAVVGAVQEEGADAEKIRKEIAKELDKEPDELRSDDYGKVKELDLSGLGVSELSILRRLKNLEELKLSNNQLTEVPKEVGQLASLRRLYLYENQLTGVPKEIGQLASLTTLRLDNNQLTEVPKEIGQLASLSTLTLSSNQLTEVPKEIGQLASLTTLWVHNNQLTEVPKEIGELASLTMLFVSNNQLTAVPKEIGRLTSLTTLWVHNNQLTEVPKEIGQLASLTRLDLYDNQLSEVPKEIGQLASLTELYLHNNQLTEVPKEIVELASLRKITLGGNNIPQDEVDRIERVVEGRGD